MKHIAIAFLLMMASTQALAAECVKSRYLFDFGSTSMRTSEYAVDTCKNTIVSVSAQYKSRVQMQECILKSEDKKTISKQCIDDGINAINDAKKFYNIDCKKESCIGVATAWARNAKNADSVVMAMNKATMANIQIASQHDEGIYGFKAAQLILISKGIEIDSNTVVLDMGGGSFQIVAMDSTSKPFVVFGDYGLATLKQDLYDTLKISEDGFIPAKDIAFAMQYAVNKASTAILSQHDIGQKISDSTLSVYGVTPFLTAGLQDTLKFDRNVITLQEVHDFITKASSQRIENYTIDHQYAFLLLYSLMKTLKINEIHILDASIGDYLVTTKS